MKNILLPVLFCFLMLTGCSLLGLKKTTVVTSYYRTKEILAVIHRKGDMRHGSAVKYYKNGNVMEEAAYKENKKDGVNNSYFENGNIKLEKVYSQGILVSLREYDKDGNLIKEETYEGEEEE